MEGFNILMMEAKINEPGYNFWASPDERILVGTIFGHEGDNYQIMSIGGGGLNIDGVNFAAIRFSAWKIS